MSPLEGPIGSPRREQKEISMPIAIQCLDHQPSTTEAIGIACVMGGAVLEAEGLAARGFEAKIGETIHVSGETLGGEEPEALRLAPAGTLATPGSRRPLRIAIGMGPAGEISADTFRRAGAAMVRAAGKARHLSTTLLDALPDGMAPAAAAQALAEGIVLGAYRFDRYKSAAGGPVVETVAVLGGDKVDCDAVRVGLERGVTVATAVALARDLVNSPAADMTPRRLVQVATEVAAASGLGIAVLDEKAIVAERLGGLAGVALGSVEPARLITLTYDPPGATATLALVGKGITFDSGGLSIKTADGMETMKTDMSGAAAVLAAMSTFEALGLRVKVIGIIPASENMPGGRATKPGDVLTIRNGKTVEVLNTDAEGRLVLADGLSLAVEAGVDAIVDVATLTGACVVALGRQVAGLMANNDAWRGRVAHAAERAGESVWPLPLPSEYRSLIDSEIADIKNIGGRYAGALTAGLFLQEFVGDVPWAHLDIAGPARSEESSGYVTKGGTGFAVRTLIEAALGFGNGVGAEAPSAP